MVLDEITFQNLYNFMESYTNLEHLFKTGFNYFMNGFLKNIEPSSITFLIKCLSFLNDTDLEYYRKIFSYSKIYLNFQAILKTMFNEVYDYKFIKLVLILLDNSHLVYKN